jgi:PKD repeat protein
MLWIGRLAAVAGVLVLASSCSDGSGLENEAPVANFDLPQCFVGSPCTFISTSEDDDQVTSWSWDFNGDGTADATTATASFEYEAAGDFDVSLTVRDAQGLSATKSSRLTVTAPVNTSPTASFTYSCIAADCTFISTSSDAAPGFIVTYAWNFGDQGTSDVSSPTHSYVVTAPTDFTVTLTVTDNEGATDVETQTVSVTPAPNTPPTAGFTSSCTATTCTFTSTSTDVAPGTIASYAWTFGDGGISDVATPTHAYVVTATTDFTVTLTVTDNQGATDSETQTITVSPPPPGAEGCTTSGIRVDCLLNVTARSTIKLKLLGVSCTLNGERVIIPAPYGDQVFLNVCLSAAGDSTKIFGGPLDEAIVFEPGSQVPIRFVQGTPDRDEPAPGAPAAQLTGTFPNWTINFEDGANPGGAGEPDFADVVLGVEAVAAP